MKCKSCGENKIEIVEYAGEIITSGSEIQCIIGSLFSSRCPNCLAESSRYTEKEEAKTKGVAEVFEECGI